MKKGAAKDLITELVVIILGIALISVLVPTFFNSVSKAMGMGEGKTEEYKELIRPDDLLAQCRGWLQAYGLKSTFPSELEYTATVLLPEEHAWSFCEIKYGDDWDMCRAACIYLIQGEKTCKADPNSFGDVTKGQSGLSRELLVGRCIDLLIRGNSERYGINECVERRITDRNFAAGCKVGAG